MEQRLDLMDFPAGSFYKWKLTNDYTSGDPPWIFGMFTFKEDNWVAL